VDELWVIFILVFGAVLLGVQALYWITVRARTTKKSINRRLTLSQQLASPIAVLEALLQERGLVDSDNPHIARLNDFMVQTGIKIDRKLLVIWTLGLSVVFFLLLASRFGTGLLSLLLGVLLAVVTVVLWLRRKRNRRIARFADQLPDALDVIVRGVKVGHPFSTALNLVAKEMPDPIGTEFGMCSDEIAFGLDVRRAIENLYRRVGQDDLLFMVVAINVQSQTGGNLAEILSRLSKLIRNRSKIRAKIKALTAEGRLSGIFLSLMPFILFGVINLIAPDYFMIVRDHPATMPTALVALSLLGIGNIVMYRMVNFKF